MSCIRPRCIQKNNADCVYNLGKTMFSKMSGRQLAGWGYGTFWAGLLFETINAVHSALLTAPLVNPLFWVGQVVTLACVVGGVSMLMGIRHRPW